MKRELTFRAFDKTYKRWYYFTLTSKGYESTINTNEPIGQLTDWQQYSGIKDILEQRVFEGDIIKESRSDLTEKNGVQTYFIYKLFWGIKTAEWLMKTQNGYNRTLAKSIGKGGWSTLEVIGNIYETPELFERDK